MRYCTQVLQMLHDGQGHQGAEQTITLYWNFLSTLYTQRHGRICPRLLILQGTKGHYLGPDMQQGSLVVHNLMDLLCINFTKLNPSKDNKEDVLVLTDAFSKFSQAFVTPNQKPITVTKLLMDKLFYAYRILAWIHCDKGHSFANKNTRTSLCSFWRWTMFNFSITEYYLLANTKII